MTATPEQCEKELEDQFREQKSKARMFDFYDQPPADNISMTLGGVCDFGSRGGISVIYGQSKAGKSGVMSAIIGAALKACPATIINPLSDN